ncbi:antigen-like protein E, partial [Ophiophagus hannah]
MYGNTISREADLPCKPWRSLPPEPAEQSELSTEDYDSCGAESNYDSISLPCERKTPAKSLDPDIKAVTGPSIFSPVQWKRNRICVLLIITGICLLLSVVLLLSNTSILSKLRSQNWNSTKDSCDASLAPFNFTELKTSVITKLKSLEQQFDEKRKISLQKIEEQLLRIERKLVWYTSAEIVLSYKEGSLVPYNPKNLLYNIQDFVIQTLKNSIWLGLTDTEKEGTWHWVDGSPLKERSWREGEPNNGGENGEDCAVLYKEGK